MTRQGGLGHVAVKILVAMGVRVTVVSTSPGKRDVALNQLGAHVFVLSSDVDAMREATGTLDGLLSTVPCKHDMVPLLGLMKVDATLVYVGAPESNPELPSLHLLWREFGAAVW
jgi:cinnamyl-alcohol dehydrogenase